jgi:hypothetical protein
LLLRLRTAPCDRGPRNRVTTEGWYGPSQLLCGFAQPFGRYS